MRSHSFCSSASSRLIFQRLPALASRPCGNRCWYMVQTYRLAGRLPSPNCRRKPRLFADEPLRRRPAETDAGGSTDSRRASGLSRFAHGAGIRPRQRPRIGSPPVGRAHPHRLELRPALKRRTLAPRPDSSHWRHRRCSGCGLRDAGREEEARGARGQHPDAAAPKLRVADVVGGSSRLERLDPSLEEGDLRHPVFSGAQLQPGNRGRHSPAPRGDVDRGKKENQIVRTEYACIGVTLFLYF